MPRSVLSMKARPSCSSTRLPNNCSSYSQGQLQSAAPRCCARLVVPPVWQLPCAALAGRSTQFVGGSATEQERVMIFTTEAAYHAYLQDVRDFLWHEIDPLVPQIERDELIPFDLLRPKFRQHHLFDCLVPEAYGGLGLTTEQYAPVLKELAKVHGGIRAMLHVHNSSVHLMETGRAEQRQDYLPRMATGELLVGLGPTEPDSGSGMDSKSSAVRQGDVYLLNGRKHLITNAREADLFAVFCFTEAPSRGDRQFSVLLVERGMPGFSIERMAPTMGCSGASHDLLLFDNVPVPVANVLGREGLGAEQLLAFLEISRVFIAVAA